MASGVLLTRYDITDLNNGKVPAFPVADPPGWDDVSLYYAKALQKMGWQKSPDGNIDVTSMWPYSEVPNTYFFQAGGHWWPKYPNSIPPSPYDQYWCHCTHGPAATEQYFLPWHRAYIYYFEVIVRSHVAELGGPDTWALPYWNYSFYDGSDPSAPWVRSNLPWAFAQPTLPDGTENPLNFSDTAKRGLQPTWPKKSPPETMYLETATPYYNLAYAHTDWLGFNGTLDGQPHGAVHDDTGSGDAHVSNTGWMSSTVTASFDPVFWLHHSEIDRFWVGWNAAGNPNPSDPTWLQAQDDPNRATRWNFWADADLAHVINVYPGDMLDPANLGGSFPYSYTYQNLPTVPAPVQPGRRRLAVPAPLARPPASAELVATATPIAAAEEPVEAGHEPVSASVALPGAAEQQLARLDSVTLEAEPPHVILHLEDITADGPPGNYEIYLNYPEADRTTAASVPHYVGLLAGFGADHHHEPGEDHEGHQGLSYSYDITDVVAYLRAHGGWNEAEATITFVPASRPREGFELQTAGLQVGRITITTT